MWKIPGLEFGEPHATILLKLLDGPPVETTGVGRPDVENRVPFVLNALTVVELLNASITYLVVKRQAFNKCRNVTGCRAHFMMPCGRWSRDYTDETVKFQPGAEI